MWVILCLELYVYLWLHIHQRRYWHNISFLCIFILKWGKIRKKRESWNFVYIISLTSKRECWRLKCCLYIASSATCAYCILYGIHVLFFFSVFVYVCCVYIRVFVRESIHHNEIFNNTTNTYFWACMCCVF